MTALEAAIAKRARKAAKRERDAHLSEIGRLVAALPIHAHDDGRLLPHTIADSRCIWDGCEEAYRRFGTIGVGWEPRWRQRLLHRRSTGPAGRPRCTGTALQRRRMRVALARARGGSHV